MKGKDILINTILNGFQKNNGVASCYCFNQEAIPSLVRAVVEKYAAKHEKGSIFIGVDSYNTRKKILAEINNTNTNLNNCFLRVLSKDFINPRYSYTYDIIITVGLNDCFDVINKLFQDSHFTLFIFTKNIMNNDFINKVRNILPDIPVGNVDSVIAQDNIYSPVEEHRYGVGLSCDALEKYNKYTEFINTTISIFGSLDVIHKCKNGDKENNISSASFRNDIAHKNGWNETLDTSIDFIKQIDDVYNPNILLERACNFFNIAKERRDLLSDNVNKLDIIEKICRDNKDKRILIVSKNGTFAAEITKYLNNKGISCGDYHDCIDDAPLVDDNGIPVLYKSGVNKGKPRIVGSQFQSSANEKQFNDKTINVLSIKCSSNVKLKIACDAVILTSCLYDNIIDVKTRFINVAFIGVPTKVYRLYTSNTIENEKLNTEKVNPTFTIINETENNIEYDENSGNIIL